MAGDQYIVTDRGTIKAGGKLQHPGNVVSLAAAVAGALLEKGAIEPITAAAERAAAEVESLRAKAMQAQAEAGRLEAEAAEKAAALEAEKAAQADAEAGGKGKGGKG